MPQPFGQSIAHLFIAQKLTERNAECRIALKNPGRGGHPCDHALLTAFPAELLVICPVKIEYSCRSLPFSPHYLLRLKIQDLPPPRPAQLYRFIAGILLHDALAGD